MMQNPADLTGQNVVIFGAGPDIGYACGASLGSAGASVLCADINIDAAMATATKLKALGITSSAVKVNVLQRESVRAVLSNLRARCGNICGVVNVVGRAMTATIAAVSDADWDNQLDINLRHQFIVAQECAPYLTQSKGCYVAIGSFNGINTSPHALGYGVAKAAVISLIRNFALEYGPRGARFNVIAPGLVLTGAARKLGLDSGATGQAFLSKIPLGKLADPADIGSAALFLICAMGRHITGHTLVVDGGSSLNYFLPDLPIGRSTAS